MTRLLHHAAFAVGLAVVGWVGAGYAGTHALALGVTVLVATFYLMGALELHRYHQATGSLTQALASLTEPPAGLGAWLGQLHPSLHNTVRLRVEGERVGLPGPALSPFLSGLLVLLGMLGTFLGMVVTLNGTGLALDSATDLQAVRASLSAPVKGLGLAFGTSVAGVAASAALGLMSALCRRERLQAAQALDAATATHLRGFSLAHQREVSYKALLQQQVQAMPELVSSLQAMMTALQQQSQALNEQLLARQTAFHDQADARSTALAATVGQHLQASLVESARVAGATLQPAVEATLAGLARETATLHGNLAKAMQQQADGLADRFEAATASTASHWHSALAEHRQTSKALSAELRAELAAQDEQRLAAFSQSLQGMAATLQHEWQQAGAATLGQQQQICETLAATARGMSADAEAHAQRTIAEIGRLVQAAAEAPRAAAEVVAELRQKLSDSMVRDNAMLDERNRLLNTLGNLLDTVNHASTEQRAAIDALVGASADLLDRVSSRFTESVSEQTARLTEVATQVGAQLTGSAVEAASLGEAFGFAVGRFGEANDQLLAQLGRIEGALSQSMARSDEQLAYYVAQAREVIDLSILSQQQIVDDLQRLAGSGVRLPVVSEA